jgi:hypothetical protein
LKGNDESDVIFSASDHLFSFFYTSGADGGARCTKGGGVSLADVLSAPTLHLELFSL